MVLQKLLIESLQQDNFTALPATASPRVILASFALLAYASAHPENIYAPEFIAPRSTLNPCGFP